MQHAEGTMNPQQVGRAGELYVAAQIHRRGGYAVTFARNMPGTDMLACDATKRRRISIQVKTRRTGTGTLAIPATQPSAAKIRLRMHFGSSWTWPWSTRTTSPRWVGA